MRSYIVKHNLKQSEILKKVNDWLKQINGFDLNKLHLLYEATYKEKSIIEKEKLFDKFLEAFNQYSIVLDAAKNLKNINLKNHEELTAQQDFIQKIISTDKHNDYQKFFVATSSLFNEGMPELKKIFENLIEDFTNFKNKTIYELITKRDYSYLEISQNNLTAKIEYLKEQINKIENNKNTHGFDLDSIAICTRILFSVLFNTFYSY